ncbi:conjugative transposon protein TraM [Chitinophaga sp. 22321]|uniref:conjugative transposon protein TraM n=1 Tax=Chitinophaga sp. 22321 TaxID=3453909 RepID=UPI003F875688
MKAAILDKINSKMLARILAIAAFFLTVLIWYTCSFINSKRQDRPEDTVQKSAFNMKMPAPSLDDKYKNKLDIYMQAMRDSQALKKAIEKDPSIRNIDLKQDYIIEQSPVETTPIKPTRRTQPLLTVDQNEKKVSEKLEKLYQELSRATDTTPKLIAPPQLIPAPVDQSGTENSKDIEKLEKLMTAMNAPGAEDPEMQRLEAMLDKIIQIQHPVTNVNSNLTGPVPISPIESRVSLSPALPRNAISNLSLPSENGFYDLENSINDTSHTQNLLAVVHDDQTITEGATVRLRLLEDIYVNNIRIPQNSFLYGLASLGNQRLNVEIKNAIVNNHVLPVKLSVYDIDGLQGIFVPGAISNQVSKDALNSAVQNLQLYSPDPSMAAQAATVGVQAAKSFIGKKSKAVTVSLKANHTVILYNQQYN